MSTESEATGIVDSLSIPLQQISRVIVDGYEITDEQEELLSNVIEVDKISEVYLYYVSDPIKGEIYSSNNQDYFRTHAFDFLKIYIQIGTKYPIEYLKAWIDMTHGYWNGGYSYFKWINYVKENEIGIHKTVLSETLNGLYKGYFRLVGSSNILEPLLGIGVHMWIIFLAFIIFIKRRRKEEAFVAIPVLLIFLTLCMATPLDKETRYMFSAHTTLPLIVGLLCSTSGARKEGYD